jgi:Uma2 family endonuclease
MEVLSLPTSNYDRITKFKEYRYAGVREYWLVNPDIKIMEAFRSIDGKYVADVYSDTDMVSVQTLPGCEIDLSLVFRD